jgi:hypothetical protein
MTVVVSAFLASQLRPTKHGRLVLWALVVMLAVIVVTLVTLTLWTSSEAYSAFVNNRYYFDIIFPGIISNVYNRFEFWPSLTVPKFAAPQLFVGLAAP